MLIIDSFGKNIYIDRDLVGYIGENILYIKGNKFADITDDGIISFGTKKIGYIDSNEKYLCTSIEETLDYGSLYSNAYIGEVISSGTIRYSDNEKYYRNGPPF